MRVTPCLAGCFLGAALATTAFAGPTVYAATTGGRLIRFDASTPGQVTDVGAITGLPNDANTSSTIGGLDFRTSNSQLLAYVDYSTLTADGSRIYTINTGTGAATLLTDVDDPPGTAGFSGVGVDFDPVGNRLRVVNGSGTNLRINPDSGVALAQGTLHYADGDINAGRNSNVNAIAYTNSLFGAATGTGSTTLYGIDLARAVLLRLSTVDGALTTVGSLAIPNPNLDIITDADFDIYYNGSDNIAYAALESNSMEGVVKTNFYTINLTTGAATLVGEIPDIRLRGFSVIPAPFSASLLAGGVLMLGRRSRHGRRFFS